MIKKSQIAINAAAARTTRFTGGEKVDCAIAEIDFEKRKIVISKDLLENVLKNCKIQKLELAFLKSEVLFFA